MIKKILVILLVSSARWQKTYDVFLLGTIKAYKKTTYKHTTAYNHMKDLKHTKILQRNRASLTRFLHSCNFRLFRGLEHSNVKLMLNIDIANRVVNNYLTIAKEN